MKKNLETLETKVLRQHARDRSLAIAKSMHRLKREEKENQGRCPHGKSQNGHCFYCKKPIRPIGPTK